MNMDAVFNRVVAKFVGLADRDPGLHASARQPHRKRFDMMVAAQEVTRLALRSPAKLASPNDDRIFQPNCLNSRK